MILIYDAGSGSLIGGTYIGFIRKETQEFYYDIIPIDLDRRAVFTEKKYLDYVITIINKLFNKLKVDKIEEIHVCRGYMFDNLRKCFQKKATTI
ncbi:MAG: hypothetical protein WDA24_11110 [Tissierellales bacterium]